MRSEEKDGEEIGDVKRTALRPALLSLALAALSGSGARGILTLEGVETAHGLLEVVLAELALLVDDKMDAVSASREEVVLEWRRPVIGVDNVAWLLMRLGDPLGKLE